MMRSWVGRMFLVCGLLFLCSCQKQESEQKGGALKDGSAAAPVVVTSDPVLSRSLPIVMYESPVELLSDAVRLRGGTLVLFSDNPWLAPVPDALRNELVETLSGKDFSALSARLKSVSNPLVAPAMTVRAGLSAGLFQRVVWVVPTANQQEQLDPEKFKEFLLSAGIVSDPFRRSDNGTLSGTVDGVAFDVVHPAALPVLTGPVLLHFDLGYFVSQFKNEVKTPLMPLVGGTLQKVRATKWQPGAVTFSYSNHNGLTPLSMRPLGGVIQRLFAEPQLLEQPLPVNWDLWSKTLYLENFFQNDEIRRLLALMEKNAPNDAGVKYLISRFSRHQRDIVSAERYLALAVAGDREYALEYLDQVEKAREQKKPEQILGNLRKLSAAFPQNPLFLLNLSDELITQKHFDEARRLLSELRKQPWSPVYYPDMLLTLEHLQKLAEE